MRIALGDIQDFADQTSLLAYCAANSNQIAGYAPGGNAQRLPCSEWPYVLGKGQVVVMGGTVSAASLASSSLFGIPVWVLALGGIGLYFLMRRNR